MKLTLLLYLVLSLLTNSSVATEITYTPNEQDGTNNSGPLPLSQAQRDQLTQLEQAIVQSPDPQATLLKVAQSNNMDPQDLVNMLERNRSDMAQASGGGGILSARRVQGWPQQIVKVVSAVGVVVSQLAAKNPRAFSILAVTLLCLIYIGLNAPRNGVVVSNHSGLLSKGHTTWWLPPPKYVDRVMDSRQFATKVPSIADKARLTLKGNLDDDAGVLDDGVQWHAKFGRKATLSSASVAQVTILLDDLIPESILEDQAESDVEAIREEVAHILYEDAALNVLASRRFSEFTDTKVRFQTSKDDRGRHGILVIPKSGDWGRYGLQPLKVVHQSEGAVRSQITYSTLKGGVFDAQVLVVVERARYGNVIVRVEALVPKKGRRLPKKVATLMVSSLCSSIVRSIQTEANQRLARQLQGKRFGEKAKGRAEERRHLRHEKEKELESMAEDRRLRWQRSNPDAGRYRPSGHRLKSPNNC